MPFGVMLRVFVVGVVAVGASTYAIYRHYSVPRPSMLKRVPSTDAGPPELVPAPELEPLEAPAER